MLVMAALVVLTGNAVHAAEETWHEAYRLTEAVNTGLPAPDHPINLSTPQASMENFMLAAEEDDWARAAYSLDLSMIPPDEQEMRGAEYARKLHFIMLQNFRIPWSELADRPDGVVPSAGVSGSRDSTPVRALVLGTAELDARPIDVMLERIKPGEGAPVWLISAQSVDNIPELWAVYRPGPIAALLPEWAGQRLLFDIPLWEWASLPVLILVSILGGMAANRLFDRVLETSGKKTIVNRLASELNVPIATGFALLLFYVLTFSVLTLTGPVNSTLRPIVVFATLMALTWAGVRGVGQATDLLAQRYRESDDGALDDNTRDILTRLSVARRVLIFLGFMIGVGVALIQVNLLDTVGFAMLGSAGVLTIIAGLAMRDVLSNIMAGLQIAITQPARIGDHVVIDGEWSYVEDITYTYFTIRTWACPSSEHLGRVSSFSN